MRLEECGHRFRNTFQAKDCYIHRKIGDSDVLISIGPVSYTHLTLPTKLEV